MKQKKLITILAVALAVCVLAVGGILACSKGGKPSEDPSDPAKDTYTVTLNRKVMKLVQYDEYVLSATLAKNGETVTDSVAWSSSDPSVVTVSNGTVKAVTAGTAVVTATWGEAVARCEVSVSKYYDPQWVVSLSDTSLALYKTDSEAGNATLEAVAIFGDDVKADGYAFTWESKDEAIATVTQSGTVTAVSKGSTEIVFTATYKTFTAYAVCKVKVDEPKILVLDETEYVCELEGTEALQIPWKEEYGAVLSITDDNGAELPFEQRGGYVIPDCSNGTRGNGALSIESETHIMGVNVFVADRFIYTAKDLETAVSNMAEGKLYALYADVDMSGYSWKISSGIRSLFTFKGEFDGRGHKLYNIESLDEGNAIRVFSFGVNSHVHDLQIDAKLAFGKGDYRSYVFGAIEAGSVVEDCEFNLDLVNRNSWQANLFEQIDGTFRDSTVRFTGEYTVVCMTSSFLFGDVSNIVYIGIMDHEIGDMHKIFLGGSNGSNYTALTGKISKLYFFASEEDYRNGNGLVFAENGKVVYNGKEYSLSDWWSNNVDLDGDGSTDNTWGVVCTVPISQEEV